MYEMTGKWIWTEESAAMGECPCAVRIACAPATLIVATAGRMNEVSRCVCASAASPAVAANVTLSHRGKTHSHTRIKNVKS